MLNLTRRSRYGILAILELARARGLGYLQIKDIVERTGVPKSYLEQILNRFVKHQLVTSLRGKRGGYQLARGPNDITLLQVIEALEGEVRVRRNEELTGVEEVLKRAEESLREALSVSLAELLLRQQLQEEKWMYYI